MKLKERLKSGGSVLRFLALLLILSLLVPRLFTAFYDLYRFILRQQDETPSGNPMKVEEPLPREQFESVVQYKR